MTNSLKSLSLKNEIENQIFSVRFQNHFQISKWNKFDFDEKSNNNFFHKSTFRNISDAFTSFNIFINEIKIWKSELKSLCVKCEILSHVTKKCIDQILSAWKQLYFKNIVFDLNIFQTNFCAFNYKSFNENVNFYELNQNFKFRSEFFEFFIENSTFVSISIDISISIHISLVIIIRIAIFTSILISVFFQIRISTLKSILLFIKFRILI